MVEGATDEGTRPMAGMSASGVARRRRQCRPSNEGVVSCRRSSPCWLLLHILRLKWEEEAEALVKESHRRLDAVVGFGPYGWLGDAALLRRYERDLKETFSAGDTDRLKVLLLDRENVMSEQRRVVQSSRTSRLKRPDPAPAAGSGLRLAEGLGLAVGRARSWEASASTL